MSHRVHVMIAALSSRKMAKRSPGLGAMIFSALLLCMAGCAGERLTALPPHLLGEWRTAEARYQGRFMKMEADRITFGMGGAGPDKLERIQSVRLLNADTRPEYRIDLLTADGSLETLTLDFTQANGGELHLKSQPKIVWRTAKASSRAPHGPELPQNPLFGPSTGNEHKTIYRIDCIHPNVCKSY
jgi:hypothetical protein